MSLSNGSQSLLSSPLRHAVKSLPDAGDDGLPSPTHQVLVHKLATLYLASCQDPVEMKKWREKVECTFAQYPLLGFEVTDEALCYYDPNDGWTLEACRYEFHIGLSASELLLVSSWSFDGEDWRPD